MPKKSASEVHEKIDESLRDYGEAFIRIVDDEVEIVHPDKVTVMTDDENRKVICVGKDVDTNVFAVLSSKESTLADLLKPRPYQESVMRALMDPEVDDISLLRRREPTFIHSFIRPLEEKIPHLVPGEKLDMKTFSYKDITKTTIPEVELRMQVDTERFNQQLNKVGQLMAEKTDRMMLYSIYQHYPENGFRRENRIARLLLSSDRRQVKRGERLFIQWRKERPGYNISRYNKD